MHAKLIGGARRKACADAQREIRARLEASAPADALALRRAAEAYRSRESCVTPAEATGRRRLWGLWTHLYTLRSASGFGVGHLGDLRRLVRWAGERGASFVGLNPLHALRNRGADVSPYSPVTRLFRNPLYLDVTATPEWGACANARRVFESGATGRERARLVDADQVDYERSDGLRRQVVERLWREFRRVHQGRSARGRAYARYVQAGGDPLRDFATYCALEDQLACEGRPRDWRRWPAEFHSPQSLAVQAFRERNSDAVGRLLWEQFELDRQLGDVAREARRAGLALGLYQDLALGCDASGFDCWAFPSRFVEGVSLGAPPDDYAASGQDWGLPPMHPWRMGESDFGLFRQVLRVGMSHAGMLRIDHVLGLLRQWWIPHGRSATQGGYVRFPASALLSVVAEESRRAAAVVVGEDLGSVPQGFQSLLARYDALSCRVLLFERSAAGGFRSASSYSPRALATATTHDLPPLAGWWSGRDLALRAEQGTLSPVEWKAARQLRRREREALIRRLQRQGALAAPGDAEDPARRAAAVHRFLAATPSVLVGVSLDDLAGEVEPLNIPGIPASRFGAWRRRMCRPLDSLLRDSALDRALGDAPQMRRV
jgi:4-alpha-glucanotransferase